MGLDWNPGNRPSAGHEQEYFQLFELLRSKHANEQQEKIDRFHEISISAYETLAAPQVGTDDNATQWIKEVHKKQQPDMSLDEWVSRFQGFYVVSLVPPCDGLPRYSNGTPGGYVEPFSFRAEFLKDCVDLIGKDLLDDAWNSKLPDEMRDYADKLMQCAESYASKHGYDLDQLNIEDIDSIDTKLDIIVCAAKWCRFWAARGHVLDAYF